MIKTNIIKSCKKLAVGIFVTAAASCILAGNNTVMTKAEINRTSDIEVRTRTHNYSRWASTTRSYLTDIGNGNMMRVQSDGSNIYVEYYDSQYNITGARQIATELPIFGGFYNGSDAYYIVTGQENPEESDTVECYRITKYDKAWNRIGSAGLYDCNTYIPFEAGSLRMTEADGYLLIRTCHEMYKSSDGYHHQANVTIQVDESNMTITDSFTKISNISKGYVSHSFNQFIKTDGNNIVAVDHGDAYPRSIALIEYPTDFTSGQFISNLDYWENPCKKTDLLKIAGKVGDNDTDASVGGFEVTDSAYLVAANSIDQENNGNYRNICILGKSKEDGHTFINWLTDVNGEKSATTPYMVKIDNNKYFVMWSYGSDLNGTVDYTYIDSNGNQISPIYSMKGKISDCEPIYFNGSVVWYTSDNKGNVTFYGVDNSGNALGSLNGLVYDGSNWVYYHNDNPDYNYTGLAANEYGWWYVRNGQVAFDSTGIAYDENVGWWYVRNGAVAFDYTGIAYDENVGWWYIRNGAVAFDSTGIAYDENVGWWYIRNGAVAFDYTGIAYDENVGWWYIKDGAVAFDSTGIAYDENVGWWYIRDGAVAFDYTGIAYDKNVGWWYIRNGAVAFDYNGLAQNDSGYWKITGGTVDFSYNGDIHNEDGDWIVTNGYAIKEHSVENNKDTISSAL